MMAPRLCPIGPGPPETRALADRFYCADLPRQGRLELRGDEARHLARVARREPGDVVEVFNGRGVCVEATVLSITKDSVSLEVGRSVSDREADLALTLYVAAPKGERFDWIVEKATELGVDRLVPLRAARSVVDPRSAKLERLRRVVLEASKQCGRNRLMRLEEPRSAIEAFRAEGSAVRMVAQAWGAAPSGWPAFAFRSAVALAVGPEGGWTEAELDEARASGWTLAGLGATRLRVETAAIVGAA